MEEAVARVALSYDACQLAETAGAAVPAGGEELVAARAVLQAADRYVESVVALARLRGSSWQQIAAALGRSEDAVRRASRPEAGDWWREHLLDDPAEAACDLDDWVSRHLDCDPGPAPVSGVLPATV
ncbi:hypothetical protein [Kribbella sp. NPDC051770]|uniref:hypothetical protein n=1 Tax=Kribbella sp. NPDC051770 TaxID=3155413 RepID=UPI0034309CAD